MMTQPSGLRGLRRATTNPTRANAAENQTGTEPLLALTLCRARPASGGSAISSASRTAPATAAAVADEAIRQVPPVVPPMVPPMGYDPMPGAFRERYRRGLG